MSSACPIIYPWLEGEELDSFLSQGYLSYMKCKQSYPGFVFMSLCPFPMMITITLPMPPKQINFVLNMFWKKFLKKIIYDSNSEFSNFDLDKDEMHAAVHKKEQTKSLWNFLGNVIFIILKSFLNTYIDWHNILYGYLSLISQTIQVRWMTYCALLVE